MSKLNMPSDDVCDNTNDSNPFIVAHNNSNIVSAVSSLTGLVVEHKEACAFFIHLSVVALGVNNNSDIALVSFGLLKGHTDKKITARRKSYVRQTGYRSMTAGYTDPSAKIGQEEIKQCIDNLIKHENSLYKILDNYYTDHCRYEDRSFINEACKHYIDSKTGHLILPEPYYLHCPPFSEQSAPFEKQVKTDPSLVEAPRPTPKSLQIMPLPTQQGWEKDASNRRNKAFFAIPAIILLALVLSFTPKSVNSITHTEQTAEFNKNLKVTSFLPDSNGFIRPEDAAILVEVDNSAWISQTENEAKSGDLAASYMLGKYYFTHDIDKAAEWLAPAAEKGFAPAMAELSYLYSIGAGVEQDAAKAYKLASEAAEEGDIVGEFLLGTYYKEGSGVDQNYERAVQWFLICAAHMTESGRIFPEPFFSLGILYYNGQGVLKDCEKAISYFKTAYDYGSGDAAYNIATIYEHGLGVPQDLGLAFEWYNRGADLHNAECYCKIGNFYEYGMSGVQQDDTEAFNWYYKAAQMGNAYGEKSIAVYYANGIVVEQDYRKAIEVMNRAVEHGDTEAPELLAQILNAYNS